MLYATEEMYLILDKIPTKYKMIIYDNTIMSADDLMKLFLPKLLVQLNNSGSRIDGDIVFINSKTWKHKISVHNNLNSMQLLLSEIAIVLVNPSMKDIDLYRESDPYVIII